MRKSSCAASERIEDAALRMTRANYTEIKKKKTGCSLWQETMSERLQPVLVLAGRRNGERKPLCAWFSFAV